MFFILLNKFERQTERWQAEHNEWEAYVIVSMQVCNKIVNHSETNGNSEHTNRPSRL